MNRRQRLRRRLAGACVCAGLVNACSVDERDVRLDTEMVQPFSPESRMGTDVGSSAGANAASPPIDEAGNSSEGVGGSPAIGAPTPASAGSGMTSSAPSSAAGSAGGPATATAPQPGWDITLSLTGTGRVTSNPAGIDCPGVCTARFTGGSSVTLSATGAPETGSYFEGWGGDCVDLGNCSLVVDRDFRVSGSFGPANIAFVTSRIIVDATSMGGVQGADQICRDSAAAAGLQGTYVAWISNAAINAIDRIRGARGWVRPDGLEVADTVDEMIQGKMFHPVRVSELGDDVGARSTLTGTNSAGLWSQYSCGDWNSSSELGTVGSTAEMGHLMSYAGDFTCNGVVPGSLVCFGIDRLVRVEPRRSTGRLAFISAGNFAPGNGVAGADALCQAEAQAAGRTGSFLAEVAVGGNPPEARFNLNGPPWVRADGVQLAATAAGYFRDAVIASAPNVTLQGEYHAYDYSWYGQINTGEVSMDSTCANWTSATAETGTIAVVATTAQLLVAIGQSCATPRPVICLEN